MIHQLSIIIGKWKRNKRFPLEADRLREREPDRVPKDFLQAFPALNTG
ncbi:hypothetical protein [Lachnoclostridium sp. An131]|nr:hypothetical protein [Lachnoclostridium sp. An131]